MSVVRRWWIPAVLVGLTVAWALLAPRPLDTRVRLEPEGDAPFDAEVFHELLPSLAGAPVEDVAVTPYERLADTTLVGTTYVRLARTYEPGADDARRLLDYVARGNTVVVAAHVLGGPLFEALGESPAAAGPVPDMRPGQISKQPLSPDGGGDERRGLRTVWATELPFLARGSLQSPDTLVLYARGVAGRYGFSTHVAQSSLDGVDTARTAVRGGTDADRADPTLVTVRHGRGRFVVSSTPLAFSNAALTGDGDAARYLAALWADVPPGPVLWGASGTPAGARAQTPLRVVLANPALRWAFWLLVLAGCLSVVFRARRWQRAIPVVAPPPNAQREFAVTVGRLHQTSGDVAGLARRKTAVLLDRLERELRIDTPSLTDATARDVAARTGVPEADVRRLFFRLRALSGGASARPDRSHLLALDRDLDALFADPR